MKQSFIITYYNEPVWMLRECLDSILALSIPAHEREIIIVDDGSDASPANVLAAYGNSIAYVRQSNQGPGAARNKGIAMASGEYIQFVDADDRLLPAYNDCLAVLRNNHPDLLMFHGGKTRYYRIDTSGVAYMLHHNIRGAACCLTFRRDILDNLRYDTSLVNEDELFNALLILSCGSVTDLGIHAYYYRKRPDSRSRSADLPRLRRRLDDAEAIIVRLHDHCRSLDGDRQNALRRRVSQLTMDYIYNIIRNTHSHSELHARCRRLKTQSLLPLPMKCYTAKYFMFSLLTKIL